MISRCRSAKTRTVLVTSKRLLICFPLNPEHTKFQSNESKYKELNICFFKTNKNFNPVRVNNVNIVRVENTKLVGVTKSSDLKWNAYVSSVVRKVSSRIVLETTNAGKHCQQRSITGLYNMYTAKHGICMSQFPAQKI